MRITKDTATFVAKKLCEPKSDELKAMRLSQAEFIRNIYYLRLPREVKTTFSTNPEYFRTTSAIYIDGDGLPQGYKTYSLGSNLPCVQKERIQVATKDANKIQANEDKIADKVKEIRDLQESIEIALYNLRTYNKVQAEFPEAYKLLPPPNFNTSLMVNIKDIRCKLDKANC